MGHKYNVPAMWTEQMGHVVAKQDELAAGAYVTGQSLDDMRAAYRKERAFWNEGGPEVFSSEDVMVPTRYGQVRVRHYRPSGEGQRPLIVYVHGGGWVIGDVDTHDRITRTLCHLTAHIRENAVQWGIDPEDVSFAGDSAGANMSMATMLMMRDEGSLTSVRAMLLYYGVYGLKDSLSMRLLGGAWDGLTEADYQYYLDQYFADPADVSDCYFNILGSDFSQGIPPCYVVSAGLDPLRDDSRTLADILNLCSVPHLYNEVEGVIHGFLHHSKMLDDTMDVLSEGAHFFTEHPIHR